MNMQEINFAYKVRHALNERLENLPENVANRLSQARQMAVAQKKKDFGLRVPVPVLEYATVGTNGILSRFAPLFGRFWLSLCALTLVVGMMGIYYYEEQRQIQETADIDVAVLVDELPPSAYTDRGFKVFLERGGA